MPTCSLCKQTVIPPCDCMGHIVCVWERERERETDRQTSTAPSQEQVCSHGNHKGKEPVGKGCNTPCKALYIDWKNLQHQTHITHDPCP